MSKTISDAIFTHMDARMYYRPRDVSEQLGLPRYTASRALLDLARGGGLVERTVDGRRVIYISKQKQLF